MKAKPNQISFSGSGRGTANHLAHVWFNAVLQTKSGYNNRRGTAASLTAHLNEKVDVSWTYTTPTLKIRKNITGISRCDE